jgi:hypothetical protein
MSPNFNRLAQRLAGRNANLEAICRGLWVGVGRLEL